MSDSNEIYLNVGCGSANLFAGYENLDNSPSIQLQRISFIKPLLFRLGLIRQVHLEGDWAGVKHCDAGKHLPYPDGSVTKIYSSHFLEHLEYPTAQKFLSEAFRVLKKDGIFRLVVPDLLWHTKKYVAATEKLISEPGIPDNRQPHDEFLNTVYGAFLETRRKGASHCYMYDLPTLNNMLKKAGFKKIHHVAFQKGQDLELASHDNREDESLHLEAIK